RFINYLLKAIANFYRIYINNIIIFSNTIEEYFEYFDYVFNLFILHNLTFSPKKNYIIYPNVELLGFYVDIFNLLLTEERLEIFRNLIFLKTLKSLKIYINRFNFL
ncbi:hypothetical protein B0T20DRAFT_349879, partial [Sordaria brevicollis]